jgi:hypothetical protein
MAEITIRDLDDDITQRLRARAAHGRTLEEEARDILRRVTSESASDRCHRPLQFRRGGRPKHSGLQRLRDRGHRSLAVSGGLTPPVGNGTLGSRSLTPNRGLLPSRNGRIDEADHRLPGSALRSWEHRIEMKRVGQRVIDQSQVADGAAIHCR